MLAVGLHDPLLIARNPHSPHEGFLDGATALIEPNQLHLLRTPASDCAFLYLDALSHDLNSLRRMVRRRELGIGLDLEGERSLIGLLAGMERTHRGWTATCDRLLDVLGLVPTRQDRRIEAAILRLLAVPGEDATLADVAAEARLSPSRFQHLFKQATGVPFRRFRLWARLRTALGAVFGGASLTDAAYMAGFASPAHLSAAFRAMFGMAPTQLMAGKPVFVDGNRRRGREC